MSEYVYEAWAELEDKLDAAITEVMLTDDWRDAPTLTVLSGMLEGDPPLPVKVHAKRIVELLQGRVAELDADARRELSDELVSLLRFVCHEGRS